MIKATAEHSAILFSPRIAQNIYLLIAERDQRIGIMFNRNLKVKKGSKVKIRREACDRKLMACDSSTVITYRDAFVWVGEVIDYDPDPAIDYPWKVRFEGDLFHRECFGTLEANFKGNELKRIPICGGEKATKKAKQPKKEMGRDHIYEKR